MDIVIPILSASTGFLGSAVLGYRLQRRVRQAKSAVVQRVKDRRDLRRTLASVESVKQQVVGTVDQDKLVRMLKTLIDKHNLGKDA